VVKVQSQSGTLVVTVRTNADVEHVQLDKIGYFTDPELAVAAVRAFLWSFGPDASRAAPGHVQ
jgi:hypothetical protein